MKKTIVYMMALSAALFTVSCQKETAAGEVAEDGIEFTAYVDGAEADGQNPESKTVLMGNKSQWSGTERIWILNGDAGNPSWKKAYKAELNAPSDMAIFKQEDATSVLSGDKFMAVYPAEISNDATWNGTGVLEKLWLNPEQKAFKGGYIPEYHVAIANAQAPEYKLSFKNVVSFFKFTVGSDNVSEVCVFGGNNELIAGNFSVDYNGGNPETSVEGAVQAGYAKVVAPKGQTLEKGATYYIAVLPANFTKGFTVEVVSNGIKGEPKTTTKAYNLTRNKIVNLGTVEYRPVQSETRVFYLKSGVWNAGAAKFDAWVWGDKSGDRWVDFTQIGNTEYYETRIPSGATGIKVYRRSPDMPTHSHNDGDRWNAAEIKIESEAINCFNVTDWWAAEPGTYTPAK